MNCEPINVNRSKKGGFYNEKTLPGGDPLCESLSSRVRVFGRAAVGSLATGPGYEINAKRQMDKLEDDYRNERISRTEHETRKKQIESGSIIY